MKKLKTYIIEKQNFLVKNKSVLKDYDEYDYHPKDKYELENIIINLLEKGETDLNCIDVSKITTMSWLFPSINDKITVSDIDISEWDVSNVENMEGMFFDCAKFNSDISNWNVSNVKNTQAMFGRCKEFNQDLSKWDVSKVETMMNMFEDCKEFNQDLSKWDVSSCINTAAMFSGCINFMCDLSNWDMSNVKNDTYMFWKCNKMNNNNKLLPKYY